jgi:hypothetical protein
MALIDRGGPDPPHAVQNTPDSIGAFPCSFPLLFRFPREQDWGACRTLTS